MANLRYAKNLTPGIGRLVDMVVVRGSGSYVWNDKNEKFLDFATGIGVTGTGHCHPKVVKAIQDQAANMIHAQVNISYHDRMLELMGKMLPIMPSAGGGGGGGGASPLDSFFFWNSGAEAVEAAVKLARHATQRPNVIVFRGGYHGRTMGTMAMTTSKYIYRAGFGPLMPSVNVAPFPYCAHCRLPKESGAECCLAPLEDLELMLKQECHPSEVAAMVIEPVQGEGGYVPAPASFLHGLRALCNKHGILLVADEVQSGVARTGRMWAVEHAGIVPDVLVFAKGIASGMPLSGFATRAELSATQPAGSMGGTYAGNIISCAAACATLDVIQEEGLVANAKARGDQLSSGLRDIAAKLQSLNGGKAIVRDVRGPGLMVGLELTAEPGSGAATRLSKACLKRGMILLTTSTFETVRFIPALNISAKEMDEGLGIFFDAMHEVFGSS
eukprot:TRINITY_DN6180_c0_g1_i1.p1 TRINITY_DN6180_c0_g1~~TRINITY_DN6180_c0_g1_i1.p1  ORF type:complete len:495 (-),score=158.40 TRINITY_DN6180_c0_g1_i1:234-1562(-)